MHPARIEAEEKFAKMGGARSFAPIIKFFEDYRKSHPDVVKMNHSNVRTHLMMHYQEQEQRLMKQEYSERIRSIINCKIDTDRRWEGISAILQEQLISISCNQMIDDVKRVREEVVGVLEEIRVVVS